MAIEIPTNTIIDKVFAGFKRITPALVAMFLASGAILFLPVHVLELLGLNGLPGKVRTVIGILFLLSITLVITIALSSCWKFVVRKIRRTMVLKNLKKRFLALAPEQKKIILELLKSENRVILLDATSGNTLHLQNNNFICRPSQVLSVGDDEICMKFTPQPWLIDLYNNEPELFS